MTAALAAGGKLAKALAEMRVPKPVAPEADKVAALGKGMATVDNAEAGPIVGLEAIAEPEFVLA